jgi:hypothetical protein
MSEQQGTDHASPVPDAGPLTEGEAPEPDQPEPAEVLGMADADETKHLAENDEQ